MFTIPNQSSVAKAYEQFDEDGRMKDSPYRDRVIDVMEELHKFTLLLRDHTGHLTGTEGERKPRRSSLHKRRPRRPRSCVTRFCTGTPTAVEAHNQ